MGPGDEPGPRHDLMIEDILPDGVAAAHAFEDPPHLPLYPGELAVIRNAVDKRRREFVTARWCARRALARLGVPPTAIPPGEHGAPEWPLHIVGSITHCEGYRAAAVAWDRDFPGIGIDAEPHAPLPDGLLGTIARDAEIGRHRSLRRRDPDIHWDRLLFSAKESIYKAWFPFSRRWLDFQDADVTFEVNRAFSARLSALGGDVPEIVTGRWLVRGGLVLTAVVVTR